MHSLQNVPRSVVTGKSTRKGPRVVEAHVPLRNLQGQNSIKQAVVMTVSKVSLQPPSVWTRDLSRLFILESFVD